MKHQVNWFKELLEDFIEEGLLSDDEAKIMRMRTKNKSILEQAEALKTSPETINRMVVELKKKYDNLHDKFPDRFPERTRSKNEKFKAISNKTVLFPHRCLNCEYCDDDKMTALDLLQCQLDCKLN